MTFNQMKFNLVNETKSKSFSSGDLAIMESDCATRIVLVDTVDGDTLTGTVVYYHSVSREVTDYPVGTYTEGWACALYRPFTGQLTIDI